LIRRAKIRNRPLAWHILRGLAWMIAVMLTIYGFLAARFLLGRPSPKVDYVAALNQPLLAVAEDERAWPIYRKAILGMGPRTYSKAHENQLVEIFDARPGSEHWPKVGPWLAAHAREIELTRQASAKSRLGFIFGRSGSIRDEELWPAKATAHWYADSSAEVPVVGVLLPQLSDLRELAQGLEADARFAQQRGEGARVMADVIGLQNLARQLHGDGGFVVVDLVAIGILERALDLAEQAVGDEKLKLSDEDLQRLAHVLARPKLAADLVSFGGERIMMNDLVQRCYTDDGSGDGHLTLAGYRFINAVGPIVGKPNKTGASEFWHATFMATATPAMADSRREAQAHYDRMMDLADANVRRPLRQADWKAYEQQVPELPHDSDKLRQPLSVVLGAHLANAQRSAERVLGHRDGIVVGIALELYRRKHGEYPARLELLVPEYLPAMPEDRINGEPVKYRIVNGKPLVYSVGADGDDDGGRMARSKQGQVERWYAAEWRSERKSVDGDWVLYSSSGYN
jgi:hypothetical protein